MNNEFEVNAKGVLSKYSGTAKDIIIPAVIDGVSIKSIKFDLFAGKNLTSVVIPEGVESIGQKAFSGNKLTQVAFPKSLKKIGVGAFWDNELSEITITENIKEIGNYAFRGNDLKRVNLPERKIKIGQFAFVFTENDFELEFTPKMATLCKYKGQVESYNGLKPSPQIPTEIKGITVTGLGTRCLALCNLTSIIIPETIEYIDMYAFTENRLTEIVIPKSVKAIYNYAFSYNPIIKITIPDKVKLTDASFENGFAAFYNENSRKGGTYTYIKERNTWTLI